MNNRYMAGVRAEELNEKLLNLRRYMPEANDAVVDFGQLLAGRLNGLLGPTDFMIEFCLAKNHCDPCLSAEVEREVDKIPFAILPTNFVDAIRGVNERVGILIKGSFVGPPTKLEARIEVLLNETKLS
jgi:hypothetical protein